MRRIVGNRHLDGIDYVRFAKDCINSIPRQVSHHARIKLVQRSTGLTYDKIAYLWDPACKSIKAEYLFPIMGAAATNGVDLHGIRGFSNVYAFFQSVPK